MKITNVKWNKNLIFCLIAFIVISIFSIYSAQTYLPSYLGNLALKQLIWYLIGIVLILVIVKIGHEKIVKYSSYLYLTGIILLLMLLLIAEPINNSKCWFIIPGVGSFQPSEFMKIFLILLASVTINNTIQGKKKLTLKDEIVIILKTALLFLIPSILTFLEPDTGVVLIYFIICISILFVSCLRKRWFIISLIGIAIVITSILYLYFVRQDVFVNLFGTNLFYRIDRLLDWRNGTGMQLENSLAAIGSSGIFGYGFNKTPIYFPESGTDFIFAVYASNFGLVGAIILVGIILFFDITIINIALKAKNNTDKFICTGIISMLVFGQFQNIGMTLGIVPITGITLPFISYGGSSLLSYMFVLGLLFSIDYKNNKTLN